MENAFTVDVEDYFQVEALSSVVNPSNWDCYDCRVETNTKIILEILGNTNQKGTFFVLGWVAKRYPQLIQLIDDDGHEVASHGMSHQLIYKQSQKTFKQETVYSKALLEDIVRKPVEGYRAATYSITNRNLWALDILAEAGFKYDSSIFPIWHDKYGISNINPLPHKLTTPLGYELVEFPISTLKGKYFRVPLAGGGYFRLFPYNFTRWGLRKINNSGIPFVFYIHPWEVDVKQPRIPGVSLLSKFRHYNNLKNCELRLKKLTGDFSFTTIRSVLEHLKLL